MLVRIIYASQACPGVGYPEIDAVAHDSVQANALNGITGALAFDSKMIIQVIEGPAGAVDSLYQRILNDSRHQGVVILSRQEIGERFFREWMMVRQPIAEFMMIVDSL